MVLVNGEKLESLPSDITKLIGDIKHTEFAMTPAGNTLLSKEDVTIQGIYDKYTHSIWWLIQTQYSRPADFGSVAPPSSSTAHNVILVYNIDDKRFSIVYGHQSFLATVPPLWTNQYIDLTNLVGLKNYNYGAQNIAKSLLTFQHSTGTHYVTAFADQYKRNLEVTTGVFSVEEFAVNIHSIRPIYTIDAEAGSGVPVNHGIEVTVESCDNHSMIGSTTVSSEVQNDEGWFMLRNSGSYHEVTIEMTRPTNTLRELLGIEVDYNVEGLR
jgi:hypothetical protein